MELKPDVKDALREELKNWMRLQMARSRKSFQ